MKVGVASGRSFRDTPLSHAHTEEEYHPGSGEEEEEDEEELESENDEESIVTPAKKKVNSIYTQI